MMDEGENENGVSLDDFLTTIFLSVNVLNAFNTLGSTQSVAGGTLGQGTSPPQSCKRPSQFFLLTHDSID